MATAVDWEKQKSDREMAIFELRMEQFFKNWAPEERSDCARFHMELVCLVRQIYADAQAPLVKQLTDICATMPIAPFVLQK